MDNKKKNTKVIIIIVVAVVLAAGAAVMGVLTFTGFFEPEPEPVRGDGVVGIITDNWDPGLENSSGEQKPGTQIPGYSVAQMNEGDTTLKISIGNPKENTVGFIATLKLTDGTVLYKSDLIKPGQGLEEVPLSQTLKKGTYDAMVYYQCVSLNDGNPLNAAESQFTLYVN